MGAQSIVQGLRRVLLRVRVSGFFDDRAAGAFAPRRMLGAPLGCSQPRTWPQISSDALERTRTRTRGLQKSAREQLKPSRAGADDPRALEREDLDVVCVGAGCRKRTHDVFNGTAMSNPKFELPFRGAFSAATSAKAKVGHSARPKHSCFGVSARKAQKVH